MVLILLAFGLVVLVIEMQILIKDFFGNISRKKRKESKKLMTQNLTHLGKPYQAEKVENTNIIIEDMGIEITEKAMKQYLLAYMGEENPTPYVRLGVKGGGCSGFLYV